jgi:hypothetical protein
VTKRGGRKPSDYEQPFATVNVVAWNPHDLPGGWALTPIVHSGVRRRFDGGDELTGTRLEVT